MPSGLALLAGLGRGASSLSERMDQRAQEQAAAELAKQARERQAALDALQRLSTLEGIGGSEIPPGTDPAQYLGEYSAGLGSDPLATMMGKPRTVNIGGVDILIDPNRTARAIEQRRLASQPGDEPLEPVEGPDGRPVYAPRSQAAGKPVPTKPQTASQQQWEAIRDRVSALTAGGMKLAEANRQARLELGAAPEAAPGITYVQGTNPTTGDPEIFSAPTRGTPTLNPTGVKPREPGSTGGAQIRKAVAENRAILSVIDTAERELAKHPQAVGLKRAVSDVLPGGVGDYINQRADPAGVPARSAIANVGSLQIKLRSGAVVTAAEFPRLAPFVPRVGDTPQTIRTKLQQLRAELTKYIAELEGEASADDQPATAPPKAKPAGRDYGIFGRPPEGDE